MTVSPSFISCANGQTWLTQFKMAFDLTSGYRWTMASRRSARLESLPKSTSIAEVESWSFTGVDSHGQPYSYPDEFDGPITQNPWSGKMAISGVIKVRARINRGAMPSRRKLPQSRWSRGTGTPLRSERVSPKYGGKISPRRIVHPSNQHGFATLEK